MSNLNQEEKELLMSVENEEWQSIKSLENAKNIYQSYAEKFLEKESSINVILSREDEEKLSDLATQLGKSTASLTGEILHKYLQGLLIEKTA
ncbi:MAG: antitoxin [Cyanobacterium sp. T60_A2020_053]|nr:antitoxin [Cyanobacterium sp. T60_A2020_053]